MKKLLLTFFTLGLIFNSAFAQIPTDSLKARYLFNGNADDISGNNKHALVNGTGVTLTTNRFGNANSAYSFDGVDGDISADVGEFESAVSISFWYFSGVQTQPYPHFVDYGDYRIRCHIMSGNLYNATDRNALFYEINNPSAVEVRGGVKPGDNAWTHVVITFSKSSNNMAIYVNGVLDKQKFVSASDVALNDGIIMFGRVRTGSPTNVNMTRFKGKLDDIFIYSKELTQAEITALYTNQNMMSTEEIDIKNKIAVYPNPFADNITVSSNGIEDVAYKVFDITGKELLKGDANTIINTSGLEEGIYMLTLYKNEELISTQKIVKQ